MTSFGIKILAIIAMTIDHFRVIIGQRGLLTLFPGASLSTTAAICGIMDVIGRMAFPLFAFMIAEGCRKTRDIKKYAGRLAIFAIISEVFFYFANNYRNSVTFKGFLSNLAGLHLENVFFTLTISVLAIYCYQVLKVKYPEKAKFLFLPIVVIAGLATCWIDSDYSIYGVVLVMALYAAQTKKSKIIVVLIWSVLVYGIGSMMGTAFQWIQIRDALELTAGACLSCLPIWFYNGKRGRKAKWVFYIYYPAHLFVLTVFGSMLFRYSQLIN